MSLSVIFEILGLFANMLIADDKYSLRNSENSQQQIQKQLFKKEKLFLNFFSSIFKIVIKL